MSRVFAKESFSITFSTTRDQDDQNLTFSFQQDRTILSGSQNKVWEENSIFKFGKLNDIVIEFSNNSIIFSNKKFFGSIGIDGIFEDFKFIGFYSEKLSTWIVPQSKIVKWNVDIRISKYILLVSPSGVIEIEDGKDVVYHDAINVTCTEKQIGKLKQLNVVSGLLV